MKKYIATLFMTLMLLTGCFGDQVNTDYQMYIGLKLISPTECVPTSVYVVTPDSLVLTKFDYQTMLFIGTGLDATDSPIKIMWERPYDPLNITWEDLKNLY